MKNNHVLILAINIACVFIFVATALAQIGVGSTRDEVIAAFGPPSGELSSGDEIILSYPGGIIVLRDNVVMHMDNDFEQRLQKGRQQIKKLDKIITDKEKSHTQAVKVYKQGGKHIDLTEVVVPGKVTIVDFYADWCGPCRRISPHLEQLAKSDPQVFLRKIDIVDWKTPVVQQYNIHSVPNIRVFDRRGKMVGAPTSSLQQVQDYVRMAK